MDARPTPPPAGDPRPPAVRPPGPVVRPQVEPDPGATGAPPGGPHRRRRLTRTRRGAVGLAIVAAALLLWPLAGWFWIPWLAGLAVLVLIGLLRLDPFPGGRAGGGGGP